MPATTERIQVAAGEQVLLSVPSMESTLSMLPDEAFENLLVVSTRASPAQIESVVEGRGGDPEKVGVVPVTGSSHGYDGPVWTTDAANPSDLTGISIRLSEAMKYVGADGWIVFDNVNVLLMYTREEQVFRLLVSIARNARDVGARGVYCIVREAITDETFAQFQTLCDRSLTGE